MPYQQHSGSFFKKTKWINKQNLIIICISLLLLGLFYVYVWGYILNIISVQTQKYHTTQISKNNKLVLQVDKLVAYNKLLESKLFNYEKREKIHPKFNINSSGILEAQLIARPIEQYHHQIIINKGKTNKLEIGMTVFSAKGIVGKISQVYKNYSIVDLMNHHSLKFGVQSRRSGVAGILYSSNIQREAIMKFVPIGSDIKTGDTIQTANFSIHNNLDRLYPVAYPVGTVKKIQNNNNSELSISIELFEDNATLSNIFILL